MRKLFLPLLFWIIFCACIFLAIRAYALDVKGNLTVTGKTTSGSAEIGNVSNAELQLLDGVTSAIQAQINAKAPTASPTFTGVVAAPTINLTGGQIAFPAAQSASADANTLDDYEEGNATNSWLPALKFGGNSVDMTYAASSQQGKYTKIGDVVFFTGYIALSAKGSSTGDAQITGLPFTSAGDLGNLSPVSLLLGNISSADTPCGNVRRNATLIDLYEITNAGVRTTLDNTDFSNASEIMISGFYKIN